MTVGRKSVPGAKPFVCDRSRADEYLARSRRQYFVSTPLDMGVKLNIAIRDGTYVYPNGYFAGVLLKW